MLIRNYKNNIFIKITINLSRTRIPHGFILFATLSDTVHDKFPYFDKRKIATVN